MLKRIDSLKSCGIFEDYRWDTSQPLLERLSVFYGANGTGKTSLAGALDDLAHSSTGDAYSKVSLTYEDNGTTRTTSYTNDRIFHRIKVFSSAYIERSQRFTPASSEMTAVLTVGEKTIETAEQLELAKEKKTKLTHQRDRHADEEQKAKQATDELLSDISKRVVEAVGRAGGRWNSRSNFSARVVRNELERSGQVERHQLSEDELQAAIDTVNSSTKERLNRFHFGLTVTQGLESRISAAISKTPSALILDTLQSFPEAANWVDLGRKLHSHAKLCIFCGSTLSSERRHQIDLHFSRAVLELQAELQDLINSLIDLASQVSSLRQQVPDKGLLFEDLRSSHSVATDILYSELSRLELWIKDTSEQIKHKQDSIFTSLSSQVEQAPSVKGLALSELCAMHNERVLTHATLVQNGAKSVEAHYLKASEATFESLKCASEDHEGLKNGIEIQLREIDSHIAGLENLEGDPTPSAKVMTEEVARLLGRRELSFEVTGGSYHVTRDGEPATSLSMGEKTAITLVHFLEEVARYDHTQGKLIVVIDDPVSSLDSEIFMGVSTYIWNEVVHKDHVGQLLLLTHNFELFRQWDIQIESLHNSGKDKFTHEKLSTKFPASFFEIKSAHKRSGSKIKRVPHIVGWPPSDAVRRKIRSTYHHGFITLANKLVSLRDNDSIEHRLDAQLLFPNLIRRTLESFLAFKRPEWVGSFHLAMGNSAELLRQAEYPGDADALRLRLTRYTHAYSHNEDPATDSVVSPDEVKTALEAIFEFMHYIDQYHFSGLCEVTGFNSSELVRARPVASDASEDKVVPK